MEIHLQLYQPQKTILRIYTDSNNVHQLMKATLDRSLMTVNSTLLRSGITIQEDSRHPISEKMMTG